MDFSPKRAAETVVLTIDFVNLLAPGVTITAATWVNTVSSGLDPNVAAMNVGAPTIAGSRVSQLVAGGVVGATYVPRVTVSTSDGQVLILPDPGSGALAINHA